jgi:hypothetical protein
MLFGRAQWNREETVFADHSLDYAGYHTKTHNNHFAYTPGLSPPAVVVSWREKPERIGHEFGLIGAGDDGRHLSANNSHELPIDPHLGWHGTFAQSSFSKCQISQHNFPRMAIAPENE